MFSTKYYKDLSGGGTFKIQDLLEISEAEFKSLDKNLNALIVYLLQRTFSLCVFSYNVLHCRQLN